MSVVGKLRRAGQYAGDLASRSVGIAVYRGYKQADNIKEQLGEPKSLQIEQAMVTFFYALTPATILLLTKLDSSSELQTKLSEVKRGIKSLGLACAEQVPLVVPIVLATTTQNPLFLSGTLGKPLLNAMVHLSSDVIEARAFKRKDLSKATPGTYDLLQKAYVESYDPHLKVGVVKDLEGRTKAVLRKEEICAESGGSCMVLYTPLIEGGKKRIGHAHITEKDVVADIGAFTGGQSDQDIRPNIEELIVNLQKPEPIVSG